MSRYADDLTLRDALQRYFEDNGFGPDGGYSAAWVDFKLGPVPLPFPNTPPRRRAVRYHDLHHIATGYETDIPGESEISAWELGSGCRGFFAAWQLNLGGLTLGVFGLPRRTFHAFVRGRHTNNFYDAEYEPLLELTVRQAEHRLGTDRPVPSATPGDCGWFAAAVLSGLVVTALTFALFAPLAVVAAPLLNLAARRARTRNATVTPAE